MLSGLSAVRTLAAEHVVWVEFEAFSVAETLVRRVHAVREPVLAPVVAAAVTRRALVDVCQSSSNHANINSSSLFGHTINVFD